MPSSPFASLPTNELLKKLSRLSPEDISINAASIAKPDIRRHPALLNVFQPHDASAHDISDLIGGNAITRGALETWPLSQLNTRY